MIQEYVWLDKKYRLRSKIKATKQRRPTIWTFDGSSTEQANPKKSDLLLNPVRVYRHPFFKSGKLVLCEALHYDRTPHITNTRRDLEELFNRIRREKPLIGLEQEYVLLKNGKPFTNIIKKVKNAYCSVGSSIVGRKIAENHLNACIKAGIDISGMNAEVLPSQWEYQIGPTDPLKAADDLWMSRFLLYRICETEGLEPSFDPKPIKDRHGSGCHINISLKRTRNRHYDEWIEDIIKRLEERHTYLLSHYGDKNNLRLTGQHEASKFDEFSYGVMDRTVSIRIPWASFELKAGYVEDRRPGANIDPYVAIHAVLDVLID